MAAGKADATKVVASAAEAIAGVRPGMAIMVGGFSTTVSWPGTLLGALADHGAGDLTIICNSVSKGAFTPQQLAERGLVKKFIGSGAGQPHARTPFEEAILRGAVELEIVPQGTFVERIRAAGAGVAGFFTPTGVGTEVARGKEQRDFDGRPHLFERALPADYALLRVQVADESGNCRFQGTTRNFQTAMATAARTVVVEADTIVPAGAIAPEGVHLPGIFVDSVVRHGIARDELLREAWGYRKDPTAAPAMEGEARGLTREQMGLRVARMVADYDYVNLGVGLPTLVARWLDELKAPVMLQGENGILGYQGLTDRDRWQPHLFDAGSLPLELVPGSSIFDSVSSFAMARGGHLDAVVLGGYEVSETGDLANWYRPGKTAPAMGGAMDLIAGGSELIVIMEHTTRSGRPRLVSACELPITARRCVDTVVTNLAVIDVTPGGLLLRELAPGIGAGEVIAATGCPLNVPAQVPEMAL